MGEKIRSGGEMRWTTLTALQPMKPGETKKREKLAEAVSRRS